MAEGDNTSFRLPDPALVSRTMADVAERSQRIVADFLKQCLSGYDHAAHDQSGQIDAGADRLLAGLLDPLGQYCAAPDG
jgi:hypothetical protein